MISTIIVNSQAFRNPLNIFKNNVINLYGIGTEEVFVNVQEAGDSTECTLMNDENLIDVLTVYRLKNSEKKYTAQYKRTKLVEAFTNDITFNNFVNALTDSLLNSQIFYEYQTTKELIGNDFNREVSCAVKLEIPYDDTTFGTDLAKLLRTKASDFTQPSFRNCNFTDYANSQSLDISLNHPYTTQSDISDLVLILRNDVKALVDIDTLGTAFNLNIVDYRDNNNQAVGSVRAVDDFGTTTTQGTTKTYKLVSSYTNKEGETVNNYDLTDYTVVEDTVTYNYKLLAVICDKRFIKIDEFYPLQFERFFDPSCLTEKVYLHSIQSYAVTPLVNACYIYTKTIVA